MKKIISVLLCALLVLGVSPIITFAASGTTYYIDSTLGNDANTGKSAVNPWKTTANLSTLQLNAGDKVLFCTDGAYECSATLSCSGTSDNPIVISSYGSGAKPLLFTNEHKEVLKLIDCSYITISNLEFTAHNGGGIWIDTFNKTSESITLTGLTMHDMQNGNHNGRDSLNSGAATARACVMVKGLPAHSRYAVNNLSITDCEMYDTGNGISLWGSWNDTQYWNCDDPSLVDPIFNENTLIKNVYFHDMAAESIIIGMSHNALVTNCRSINCCQDKGVDENGKVKFYNAAIWFWGSDSSTVQNTEIAGQKNVGDGMAVDFDSYTQRCTYQYIYSHDNNCFMCNCANMDGQHGNTVRYCLSVNDNGIRSRFSADAGEFNFSFYNNTLINIGDVYVSNLHDSLVANNIFIPKDGCNVSTGEDELNPFTTLGNVYRNNCYYNCPNPFLDMFSVNTDPCFVSEDTTKPESFILKADSPLIGKGYAIEDETNTKDFFGNDITSNNIGCYGGSGVQTEEPSVQEKPIDAVWRMILDIFKYLGNQIMKLFK